MDICKCRMYSLDMKVLSRILYWLAVVVVCLITYMSQSDLWNESSVDSPEYRFFLGILFTALPLLYLAVRRWFIKDIDNFISSTLTCLFFLLGVHLAIACMVDAGLMVEMDLNIAAFVIGVLPIVFMVTKFKNSFSTYRQSKHLLWQWALISCTAYVAYRYLPLLVYIWTKENLVAVIASQMSILLFIYGLGWFIHKRALHKLTYTV